MAGVSRVAEPRALPAPDEDGEFRAGPVDVGWMRILRIQGYVDPERVRPRIRLAAERAAEMAADLADGRVGYRRVPVTGLAAGRLELAGGHRFHCGAFTRHLAECRCVVVFVLTAGAAFDERIGALMRDDQPVEGLFLDSAGWLAVESVTRQFSDGLKSAAAGSGLRVTRRMGPGYRYRVGARTEPWRLEEQRDLFAALAGAPLPARLLDSAAMLPKMSRSGLYGLRVAGRPDALPACGPHA